MQVSMLVPQPRVSAILDSGISDALPLTALTVNAGVPATVKINGIGDSPSVIPWELDPSVTVGGAGLFTVRAAVAELICPDVSVAWIVIVAEPAWSAATVKAAEHARTVEPQPLVRDIPDDGKSDKLLLLTAIVRGFVPVSVKAIGFVAVTEPSAVTVCVAPDVIVTVGGTGFTVTKQGIISGTPEESVTCAPK